MSAICIVMMASALAVPVGSAVTESQEGFLRLGDWHLWRFNVTPESDLVIKFDVHTPGTSCRPAEGMVAYLIKDGAPFMTAYKGGSLTWTPEWGAEFAFVHAGAFGHEVSTPCTDRSHGYDLLQGSYYQQGGAHSERTLTAVIVSTSDACRYYVNATSTHGVLSRDEASGHGIARTREQFSQGVHATVDPFVPVAGAGALMRERHETKRDLLGWFAPTQGGFSITKSSLTANGVVQQPSWVGGYELYSHAPTTWEATIDTDTTLQQAATSILGLIELPDDSYLTAVGPTP